MQHLPEGVVVQVGRFLGAMEDQLAVFGQAMQTFSDGNITGAIQQLYFGVRSAAAELVPEEWLQNENFTKLVGAIDSTLGNLSRTVIMFQQQLLMSNTCWR